MRSKDIHFDIKARKQHEIVAVADSEFCKSHNFVFLNEILSALRGVVLIDF